jgi:hypothetical protein
MLDEKPKAIPFPRLDAKPGKEAVVESTLPSSQPIPPELTSQPSGVEDADLPAAKPLGE